MAQHFLLSAKARTLSAASVWHMSDQEVETAFRKVRWPQTDGAPICPACGGLEPYEMRRHTGALRFECKACRKEFSITSGTLFASHKLSLRTYLAAIAVFCNEVKGKSMLAMSREIGLSYKAAFVLCHKLREAMAAEVEAQAIEPNSTVEIDGAFFGGYKKPKNNAKKRVDRRRKEYQTGNRKAVVVVRERNGRTIPQVFPSEHAALDFIKKTIPKGAVVHGDEATSWNTLHGHYEMYRINHTKAFSLNGACTNWAESYFSRLRRAENGHHHHISSDYLLRYAQEGAWREDNRRRSNGDQVRSVSLLAMRLPPSPNLRGYWQRRKEAA